MDINNEKRHLKTGKKLSEIVYEEDTIGWKDDVKMEMKNDKSWKKKNKHRLKRKDKKWLYLRWKGKFYSVTKKAYSCKKLLGKWKVKTGVEGK